MRYWGWTLIRASLKGLLNTVDVVAQSASRSGSAKAGGGEYGGSWKSGRTIDSQNV